MHSPDGSAIHQLLLNACQATRTGYISLVCEDVSRKDSVPEGYEASLPTSIISIRITDTGNGMPQEFADHKIFQPYAKWDHSTVSRWFLPNACWGIDWLQSISLAPDWA